MYVKGAGSGAANKGTFLDLMNFGAESEVGEAIEEEVMFVVGNGSGAENDVGNTDNKPSSDKPMFFFGQAGCLKLSPIKQSNLPKVDSSIENNVKTNNLFKDVPTVVDGGHSSGSPNDELELNSKNATESEGKSDTTNEAVVSVQPTEQCSVESSQSENKSDATNEPEVIESVQAIEKANAASESQQANETSSDVKSEEKEVPNETLSSPGATVPTATENEESSLQNQLVSAVDTKGPEREPEPEKIKSIVPASPEKDKPATETVASIVPTLTTKMEEAAAETSKPIELAANCSEIKDCAPCNDELAVPISTDTDGCVSEKVEPAESPLSKKDERAASDADDLRPNIPSNEIPAETPEATAADRSTESPPSSNQLNATSHQSITQEISETTSKDESDDVNSEIASDVAAADQPITSKENDESHEVLPEPSATDDTESLNVNLIESKPSSKDIDTVPESKTENLSECAVKSNETVSNELDCDKETVPNDDTTSELPSNVDERAASSLKLNEIEGTSEVNELLHPSDASKTPDTLESNKVLSVAEDENAQSTLEENVSSKEPKETIASSAPEELAVSVSEAAPSLNKDAEVEAANQEEPAPETNSSDSKVPSLIIDSRSCSNDPQRTEASMSPPPPATAVDDKEVLTNEVGLAPTENLSKHVELLHQTSLSNTEPEDVLGITSVPENFSTLTATDQSDEIVSEPVIDHLTPDVTSISTPSFDDQDHRTSDSILNDEVEPMEIPPADISIKEIGKFQIFNRKIDEERTPEQKDDVTSTPKLQYEGSEETETPLVLTRPAMSEVPLTVTDTPSSIDSAKDPKSSESASTSRMVETADKQPEVADPLQINSPAGEIVNSKPDSLTQFPMSFKNTQINNRKRPLVTKKDFDTDESSSEISEEEVEVKRQKTKPKFSHLAARKNAEIKRKATQIDCSTDEDEPVNKAHLKTISTELLTIENAVKQKKAMNEKTPNKMIKTDDPATSTQVVRNVTVAPPPVVHRETVVEEGKLEPLCLTTSKTVPKVETSANLPTEKMDISADLRPTTAVAIIPTAVLDKAKESLPPIVPIETKPVEVLESKIKPEEVETKPKEGAKVQPELLANKGAISKDEKVTEKEQKMEVDEEKSNDEIKSKTKVQSNPVPKDEAIDTQTIQKKVTATKEDPLEQKIAKVEEKSLIEEKTTAGKDKQETSRAADLKTTSDADKTKVEVKVSKPGPKSKKAAAVAAQTVTDVPSITPSSAPTDVPKGKSCFFKLFILLSLTTHSFAEPETIQTTTTITRTRTTRALAANQPSTEPTVPEPIPKSAPSSRKATPPPPAAKPTPAKPAPKAAAKAKPPPKPKAQKKQAATKEPAAAAAKTVKESDVPDTKSEAPRKRKLMGLVFDDSAIISTNDGEAPVRQSRRIAQIKIKEEAERRKEEEEALKQMKAASDKKKKVVDETYTVKSESSASEDDSEQKLELKKKGKKKAKGANPWQTDSDHEETDISEEEHYESDHKLVFFKSDHEFSPESDIEDESQIVQTKRARTAVKHDDEHEIIDDGYACQKCNKHDHPEWILLCDKCDKGYHCSCLVPMLFIIPEGDWFCPLCQQDKLIETLESQLQNLDRDLKEKELEEIRRQRAAFTSVNVANVLPDEPDEPEYQKPKTARKRPTTSRRRRKNDNSDRSDGSSSSSSGSSRSGKSGSSSSSSNSSDDEPIYKLRKRRQVNVSYRFNEYDDLINSAIKKEMDTAEGAGNLGRGKDISTIIEADKEEKRIKRMGDDDDDDNEDDAKDVSGKTNDDETKSEEPGATEKKAKSETKSKASASDSDSEPIRKVQKRPLVPKSRKKNRKLNSLDIESEDDDGSDDDFRTSSFSEDEEDENFSGESDSDSSLEVYRRKKGKKGKRETRRSVRSRRKRYDDAFINDSDGDDDDVPIVTRKKKKKKEDSDFSEFNGESTDEEAEEDVDSEDLCDSTDSNDSDRGWRSKKSKKAKPKRPPPRPPTDSTPKPVPKKKVKKVEDAAFRAGIPKSKGKSISDESEDDDVQTKSRRTRGKKLTYLNLLDEFESSDSDGIKPGVKRPDTPPEERAAFIKKQEEIKRMLAEKNTVAAAALAAPKLTGSTPEKARRPAPVDSLSTIPRSIIQNAKALDPDYKRGKDSDDTDGFDDDLPDDFDAEGMDEEEIAKMMEEEDFAQQQLKAVGERVRKMKEAEMLLNKKKEAPKVTETSVIVPTAAPPVVVPTTPTNIPTHLATPPSVVVSPSSFSPRPAMPLSHLIRPPHSSPLSPGNVQHMQPHPVHHPQHSPLASQHLPMHPHLPPPHGPHHINALNTAHPSHQMVRGPPHHMLHPGQHPMQHFSPLQRHPMQLTQAPHISPNSQMAHRPLHPSIRSHHPLQMHPPPPQMQSHAPPPPSMVIDYPGDAKMMKLTKSGVEPKKRGRKSKAELQAIEQAKVISAPDPSTSMGPSLGPPLLQHPPTTQEPIIPTTVLAVQNTRLMDPSELGPPGAGAPEVKKRGRRKKFTPLRESLNKPVDGAPSPATGLEQKTNPILAERLGIHGWCTNFCFVFCFNDSTTKLFSFFFVLFGQIIEIVCQLLRLHNCFRRALWVSLRLLPDCLVHHSLRRTGALDKVQDYHFRHMVLPLH